MTHQSQPSIAIVDYGMGNRRSAEKALQRVGAITMTTADHDALRAADALVLPGVGAFPQGMENLRQRGLDTLLHERVANGTPVLGICLGMQLLFDSSEEHGIGAGGLGLIRGHVRALAAGNLRVPHIGWNEVRFERHSPLIGDLPPAGCPFYHVHSYVVDGLDWADVVGTAEYGERFVSVVAHDNIFGTQFHPEKSSRHGLALLANFVRLCSGRAQPARPSPSAVSAR